MRDLKDVQLFRVDTQEDVASFLEWLAQPRSVLAFDTETGGINGDALSWWKPGFKIRLVQFGDVDSGWVLRADRFGQVIEDVFTQYTGDFVGHNSVGFDSHALRVTGFSTPPSERWHDTLMMSRILDSRGFHGLKYVAEQHFGAAASAGEKMLNTAFKLHGFSDKGVGFSEIPFGTAAYDVYSAMDVVLTARIYEMYKPRIDAEFREAYDREMGAWFVTLEHESKGLPVDIEFAKELKAEYELKLAQVTSQLHAIGIKNPNSKAQKLAVLTAEGFEPEDFTESGEPKLDKAALEKIASPTAMLLMEHSRISGWLTKYIDKVINSSAAGKVYPTFNPFGAKTGRQAAFNPPLQQLPGRHPDAHKIRNMFLPRPGEKLWSIDYDGEENRLAAHFSNDEALIRLIMSDEDIHKYTASVVYGIPEDEITKDQRSLVKNVVYAEQYGAGIKKLMKMLSMPKEGVIRIKQGIADAYPQLTAWKKQVAAEAKARYLTEGAAYAYTWGGRKVYADEFPGYEPKFYTLANYVLQGTGADVLKEALNRIAAAGLSQYVYLPVHDELLFSLPEGSEGEALAACLADIMTFKTEFRVPLTCSPDYLGDKWQPH